MKFISPCCKLALNKNKIGNLVCSGCLQEFSKIDNYIFDFIPKEHYEDKKLRKWIDFQNKYSDRAVELRKNDSIKLKSYAEYHKEFINKFCYLDGKVLDIGCGPMLNHFKFINTEILSNIEYTGLDPQLKLFVGSKNCFKGVGEYLPLEDNSFDCIMLISVLDHILRPNKVIKEIKRVLRKNGILFISNPQRHLTWKTELRKFFFHKYKSRTHVSEFNRDRMIRLITKHGFKIKKIQNSKIRPKNLFISASL